MSLRQWLDNAWLKQITPSAQVVESLLAIAEREIGDASLDGISVDGRFDHAYDAIRSLCEAALRASGYDVPRGGRKHEHVIASLEFTVDGQWTDEVDLLDRARRLRHQSLYERIGVVQRQDADDLLATARRLLEATRRWLQETHPELV